MSDAEQNYAHTKSNVKIPPGWLLVEDIQAMDPVHKGYMWWNPLEGAMGAWLPVNLQDAAQTATMSKLWDAGSTCFIEQDPNPTPPAPPPAPAFLSGGFAPPPPPPTATPVPPTPQPPMAAAPAFIPPPPPAFAAPAAPVVAPVAPVIPVPPAIPQAPATMPIPVIPPTPKAPVSVAIPVPVAVPVATVHTAAPAAEDESSADQNEVDAWLAALDGVKDRIKALEEVKAELVKKIVKVCFPNGLHEGAQNCKLPDGRKLTITGVVNRTFDDALVNDACQKVIDAGGNPEGVFVSKLALGTAAYKALPLQYRNLLADCVTEKEGTPQLKVTEPKK